MNPNRWEQITDIYTAALELKASERAAFLDGICAGDDELRREVESLLKAYSELDDFISAPVIKDIAPLLTTTKTASLVGRNLAHYRIISLLGAGGMGEVYLAEDTKLGRKVALKTLPQEYCGDSNLIQRFKTEARAAATLNHPNIATLYSVEESDDCYFITMEYVAGKTLSEVIPKEGLEVKVFLEWFVCIAGALAHSHEKGIIHRDVKPGNIMIPPDGGPKVLDFGLAQIDRQIVSDHISTLKMTQPGQILGTPSYMSPEQAEGKEIDARSDIFSLGVVMYEAITGTRPFVGDSYATIVSNLLKTEPPLVSDIKPKVPYLLARLISRCLQKSRRQRFQSMNEVRVILEEVQEAVKAGVSMDSFAKRLLPKEEKRTSRILVYSILASLILAFSVFAYYYFQANSKSPISFENMTLRKLSQNDNVTFVQITPDGKAIVYFTLEDDSTRSIWIRRIEDRSALQLVSKELKQFWGGIGISPDGGQIFYIMADENAQRGTLYRISSLGGTPRKLIESANDVGGISPDGQRILFVRRTGKELSILSANTTDGGREQPIYQGQPDDQIRDPQFSADSKSILFSKRQTVNGKNVWSLIEIPASGGAERTILTTNEQRIGELAVLKDGQGLVINKYDNASKLNQIYYVSLADGKLQRITNDLNSYHGVGISDDGDTIVSAQNLTNRDIWIYKDGENPRKLTTESNINTNAVFTPDGRIVYDALDHDSRPDIWIMNADGSNPQQLTQNNSYNLEPQVTPDGRFIVFTSDRTGESKIWRMNLDGSNPTLLTNINGAGVSPVVSPDSQTVYFWWLKENKRVLAKVPITDGEVTEQPAFGDGLWAISPDGKQVAFVFLDKAANQYKVRVRPIDAEEPSKIFNIPAVYFLKWTWDGQNLLYRSLEPSTEMLSVVWTQPLAGGAPKQFLSVKPERVSAISQSNDGKQTVIVRTKTQTNTIMLTKIKN
jgi:serine/threonine protein kinase